MSVRLYEVGFLSALCRLYGGLFRVKIIDNKWTNAMHLQDCAGDIPSEVWPFARNHCVGTCCQWTEVVDGEPFTEAERDLPCNDSDVLVFRMPMRRDVANDQCSVAHNV